MKQDMKVSPSASPTTKPRRRLQTRPSMDPAHRLKVATAETETVAFWNLDLSDVCKQVGPTSLSDRDLMVAPPKSEGSPSVTRVSSSPDFKMRFSVRFNKVETREFERVLEVNPYCAGDGPCLGLGWNYKVKKSVELEAYEKSKIKSQRRFPSPLRKIAVNKSCKKNRRATALSAAEREKLAKRLGFSNKEIQWNVFEIQTARKEWKESSKKMTNDRVQEKLRIVPEFFKPRVGPASAKA